MLVKKNIGPRPGSSGQRFTFHVVEGAKNQTPGRIRTLRVDTGANGEPWVRLEWKEISGRKVGLKAVHIASDMAELGAFFLEDAYREDPNERRREKGWATFLETEQRRAKGENVGAFPQNWLPSKVIELQEMAIAEAIKWEPVPFDAEGDLDKAEQAEVDEARAEIEADSEALKFDKPKGKAKPKAKAKGA